MGMIEIFNEGDCWIGDPSDGTHGGLGGSCRRCSQITCKRHTVTAEGQRFCVRCWEETRAVRERSA